jgi:hypothetical protein
VRVDQLALYQGTALAVPKNRQIENGLQPLREHNRIHKTMLETRSQFAILISASFLIAARSFAAFTINRTPVPSA